MANKRMFSVDVVETDAFLDLPPKVQALYFHLGMRADDDGFVSSPRTIVRTIGCNAGDLKQLEAAGYVISFNSGVLVVTDWKVNNTLKSDRHTKTVYQRELSLLKESTSRWSLVLSALTQCTSRPPKSSYTRVWSSSNRACRAVTGISVV